MAVDLGTSIGAITSGAKSAGVIGVSVIAWLGIVLICGAIAGVLAWVFIRKKKFKNKIFVWQKVGSDFEPTIKDKAMEIRHGKDGTTVFYLMKLKKIIPKPNLQIGRNNYHFFERSDGEWINFNAKDFDEESRKMGAHFLDKEMRHVRLAIEKNMTDRLDKKPSWLAQHWTVVAGVVFITMLGIMVFLLFDKWIELAGTTNAGVETARLVLAEVRGILSSMDNICVGGSGIIPA